MDAAEPIETLMERYVAGDIQAFDALYEQVAPRVFNYLLSMTHDHARAEDLCQTTFLKLHRARAGWVPRSPVVPWVMTIARNAFYDEARKARRAPVHLTPTGEVPDQMDIAAIERAIEDEGAQAAFELTEAISSAVARLAAPQREALALTKIVGLSQRDAAIVLGATETAIKLRVHRAYETLRTALRRHQEHEP